MTLWLKNGGDIHFGSICDVINKFVVKSTGLAHVNCALTRNIKVKWYIPNANQVNDPVIRKKTKTKTKTKTTKKHFPFKSELHFGMWGG